MLEQLMKFAAKRGPLQWLGLCLLAIVAALVLFDWTAEAQAWIKLEAAGFSSWQIILTIIITWVRNSTFWAWVWLGGMAAFAFRQASLKRFATGSEQSKNT